MHFPVARVPLPAAAEERPALETEASGVDLNWFLQTWGCKTAPERRESGA